MTRCAITCSEYGCDNKIFYKDTDTQVRLYCSTHRTKEGRHSAVRELNKTIPEEDKEESKPKNVLYVCSNKKCNHREEISNEIYMSGKHIPCRICKRQMIYRTDL
jgi:hypothetical protein